MFIKFFYISAILLLAFTVTAFGQDHRRTLSKPAKIKQAKKGVAEWTDILARKNNKTNRKPLATNLMKGHEGMQERKAASRKKAARKRTRKANNFTSTTQPFVDGVRKKRKPKTQNLLPFIEQDNVYRKGKRSK